MNPMNSNVYTPVKRRVGRRRRHEVPSSPAPVGPLVLVSASYVVSSYVDLTFSRAIDVAGIAVDAFNVFDGPTGWRFLGFGEPALLSPNVVRVEVTAEEEIAGPDVTLTATAANGIVAADGGEAWAGATDLELPFP